MVIKLNPDIPRMGYILAYLNTGDFLGNQILKHQLKAGFSDEEAQITHIEVSGGGYDSINIAPPLSHHIRIDKKHKGRFVYILRYKNDDYEKRGRYKVAYFSAMLNNLGYDIWGILRFILKWIGQNNRLFFCSEGALWALQKEYPECLNHLKPYNCMPAHFLASPDFETIWKGYI